MASGVLGLFEYVDSAMDVAGKLKESNFDDITVFSPVPLEGVEEVLGEKKSVIKRFSLFGAISGGISGFLLAAVTSILYPLPTGGRPIIDIPPFLLVAYEVTILFGIIFTLIGFFISSRLPALRERTYDISVSSDRFGILVECGPDKDAELVEKIMRDVGVDEVRRIEDVR